MFAEVGSHYAGSRPAMVGTAAERTAIRHKREEESCPTAI
jgi:hypothetical protein